MSNKDQIQQIIQKVMSGGELNLIEKEMWSKFLLSRAGSNGPLQSVSSYTNTFNLGEFYDWRLIAPGINFSNVGGLVIDPNLITVNYRWIEANTSIAAGPNGTHIEDIAIDPTSTYLYVVGSFSAIDDAEVNCVARYTIATGVWENIGSPVADTETVNPTANAYACACDSSGNLYVGGDFQQNYNRIAKWNGTSWSAMGSGFPSGSVWAMYVDGSDNLYVAGSMKTTYNCIAKWNGSSWATIGGGVTVGSNVYGIVTDSNGNVYIGGTFTQVGGSVSVNNVAKWNGTIWSALANDGLDNSVFEVDVDSNDHLYVGGSFQNTHDLAKSLTRCARWNGVSWENLSSGLDATVYDLDIDSDNIVYFGGTFTDKGSLVSSWNGTTWVELGDGWTHTAGKAFAFDDTYGTIYGADYETVYIYFRPYYYVINLLGYVAENQSNKTTTIHNPGGNNLYPTELAVRNYAPQKYSKTAAPTTGDDIVNGYYIGDIWIDTTNDNVYILIDDTESAAIWIYIGDILNIDFSTSSEIGAALTDSDQFIVGDQSDSDIPKRSLLSRFWTYINTLLQAVTSLVGYGFFLDEDTMVSDDATKVASQQSIKAYVDSSVGSATDANSEISVLTEKTTLVDADIALIEDSAATNGKKKTLFSDIWTYIKAKIQAATDIVITILDIDGATDIGAALADADLIIVDDGASGTNRKSAVSRIWTYIQSSISALTEIGASTLALDDLFLVYDLSTTTYKKASISRIYTLFYDLFLGQSGWIVPSESWTYVSATTFTVNDDVRGDPKYQPGSKVSWYDSSTKYGVIEQLSYSAPNTTVTLIQNDDYSITGSMSNIYLSRVENPNGWPGWFNYTPTLTAGGSMTVSSATLGFAKWQVQGDIMFLAMQYTSFTLGGTANSTLFVTYPGNVNGVDGQSAVCAARDSGSGSYPVGTGTFTSSSTIYVRKADLSNWTLSTSRAFLINGTFEWTAP